MLREPVRRLHGEHAARALIPFAAQSSLHPIFPVWQNTHATNFAFRKSSSAVPEPPETLPGPLQALARSMGAAAGARGVAARLGDLEARLPVDGATKCASFRFWEAWRRSVARAESAAELAPQVRTPSVSPHP